MFVLMYLQKMYLSSDMGKSFIVRSYLLVPTDKPQLLRIKKNYRYYFMKKMKTSLIFGFFHLRCQNHLTLTYFLYCIEHNFISCNTETTYLFLYQRHYQKECTSLNTLSFKLYGFFTNTFIYTYDEDCHQSIDSCMSAFLSWK